MLTAFEIVKSAYPGIPDAIMNEYAELLPAEASAISAEYAATDFFFIAYNANTPENVTSKIPIQNIIPYYTTLQINFLNPQNLQFRNAIKNDFGNIEAPEFLAQKIGDSWVSTPDGNWTKIFRPTLITNYDNRLYEKVSNKLQLDFIPSGERMQYSFISTMSASSVTMLWGASFIEIGASALRKPYSGISAIIALYENGVTLPDVNYEKAYSFLTYVNAYKKFSTEIDSERAYLQREAEAQLASYRQDYTDRAQREKSDLQSKKIQMLMAIDNDTKAATRDFQNMLLNAQNLKQNLRGQIG